MAQQLPMDRSDEAGAERDGGVLEVAHDLATKRLLLVNVVFVGAAGAGDREWVLVDAGLPGTAGTIRTAAAEPLRRCAKAAALLSQEREVVDPPFPPPPGIS